MKEITDKIKIEDISRLYGKYMFGDESKCLSPNGYQKDEYIVDCLQAEADKITEDDVSLENKIILSMAIRLKAEEFMISIIKKKGNKFKEASSNQTRDLVEKMKNYLDIHRDANIFRILDAVNIVTPEQIHINSFMYEPLVDMDIIELLRLYEDVKSLSN